MPPHMDLMFVTDTHNHRMQSFRSDGTAMQQWGSFGTADGLFHFPEGVAVLARSQDRSLAQTQDRVLTQTQDRVLARSQDRSLTQTQDRVLARSQDPTRNCLFITDGHNHRVQVFGVEGNFIRKWGSRGQGDGQFDFPAGISIHPTQGLVYVTDYRNHRVQVFDSDGTFISKWGTKGSGDGQFAWPNSVAVLARSQDRGLPTQDLIFVADSWNDRIQAFRSDGTFLFKWGSRGSADGQFAYPSHLVLDSTRNLLFVTDQSNNRIQVFGLDGTFIYQWGSGKFTGPTCVALHPTQDVVYVSDLNGIHAFSMFHSRRKRKRVADF